MVNFVYVRLIIDYIGLTKKCAVAWSRYKIGYPRYPYSNQVIG